MQNATGWDLIKQGRTGSRHVILFDAKKIKRTCDATPGDLLMSDLCANPARTVIGVLYEIDTNKRMRISTHTYPNIHILCTHPYTPKQKCNCTIHSYVPHQGHSWVAWAPSVESLAPLEAPEMKWLFVQGSTESRQFEFRPAPEPSSFWKVWVHHLFHAHIHTPLTHIQHVQ